MIRARFKIDRHMEFESDSDETIEFRSGDFDALVIMEPPTLHEGRERIATVDRHRLQINILFSSSDGRVWRLVLVMEGDELLRLIESKAIAENTKGTVIEVVFARGRALPHSGGRHSSAEELDGVLTALGIGESADGIQAICRGLANGDEKEMAFTLLRSTVEFDRRLPWGSILTHASQMLDGDAGSTVQLQATAAKAGQMPGMTGPSESCVVK